MEVIQALASIVALLGSLVALGKGAIDLYKEYQANKTTLSAAFKRHRLLIGSGFGLMAIAVVIGLQTGALNLAESLRGTPTVANQPMLTVQVWDVQLDQKHAIVASRQFPQAVGTNLSEASLQEVGTWVTQQVGAKYNWNAPDLKIHIHIPADLTSAHLSADANPPGPLEEYYWVVSNGSIKSREPVTDLALASLGQDFWLEFGRPGYETQAIKVTWRQELDQELVLKPNPVGVGIEDFSGDKNSVATWLSNYLVGNPRFAVKDPGALAVLRDTINREATEIARHPESQVSQRTSLGLELIISGNYQAH